MAVSHRGRKVLIGVGLALGSLLLAGLFWWNGLLSDMADGERFRRTVEQAGLWGPILLVLVEAIAIVISPLPSAPIAVAAGAAYGTVLGTVLVVLGAVLGSSTAFLIARLLGYDAVRRVLPRGGFLDRLSSERSQTFLMGLVFVSRLVPFLSFDAVSYAAGLTPLRFWRFLLATTAGVIPVAAALVYAGSQALEGSATVTIAVLGLLMVTSALPFIVATLRRR